MIRCSTWWIIPLLCLFWNKSTTYAWLGQRSVRNLVPWFIPSSTTKSPSSIHQEPSPRHQSVRFAATGVSQADGNSKIEDALRLCNVNSEDVTIEWKPGRIIVTAAADAVYLSNDEVSAEDQQLLLGNDKHEEADLTITAEEMDESRDELLDSPNTPGVDLTLLARAINVAFEDTPFAELYEIEVTTPGVLDDELRGSRMWKAYRGFDVIAVYDNPKSNKIQTLEGRLVERNDEHTILNMKGRMRKLPNETVKSVKLPKAKREKGS